MILEGRQRYVATCKRCGHSPMLVSAVKEWCYDCEDDEPQIPGLDKGQQEQYNNSIKPQGDRT